MASQTHTVTTVKAVRNFSHFSGPVLVTSCITFTSIFQLIKHRRDVKQALRTALTNNLQQYTKSRLVYPMISLARYFYVIK